MRYPLNKLLLSLICLGLIVPGYAKNSSAPVVAAQKKHKSSKSRHGHKTVKHKRKRNYMEGPASFYSSKFEGRRMADGLHFKSDAYTAAHPRLPLGTKLKITDIDDDSDYGKVIYLEVTDRMSRHTRNIIDLSPAAAQYLNQTGRGLHVRLQVVSDAEFESHDMNKLAKVDASSGSNSVAANDAKKD